MSSATSYVRVDLGNASATIAVPGTREVLAFSGVTRRTVECHIKPHGWELVPGSKWGVMGPFENGFQRLVRRTEN